MHFLQEHNFDEQDSDDEEEEEIEISEQQQNQMSDEDDDEDEEDYHDCRGKKHHYNWKKSRQIAARYFNEKGTGYRPFHF